MINAIQKILDDDLYSKFKIRTFYLYKQETTKNNDYQNEYIVYRLVSNPDRIYGDGEAIANRYNFDIKYYYKHGEIAKTKAINRIEYIKKLFRSQGFRIINGPSDLYSQDTLFDGFNLEISKSVFIPNV